MTFRIFWLRDPLAVVAGARAALEAAGADTRPLGRAMAGIDDQLGRHPLAAGESREELWVRVLTVSPLSVLYEVDEAQRLVVVKSATYRSRPG